MKTNTIFLLLVLAAGQSPKAAAQSPGIFTATGNMITPRYDHTATLLANGKVLVAGGVGNRAILVTAELFNPSAGTFEATGNMRAARAWHTATLLADGRV